MFEYPGHTRQILQGGIQSGFDAGFQICDQFK